MLQTFIVVVSLQFLLTQDNCICCIWYIFLNISFVFILDKSIKHLDKNTWKKCNDNNYHRFGIVIIIFERVQFNLVYQFTVFILNFGNVFACLFLSQGKARIYVFFHCHKSFEKVKKISHEMKYAFYLYFIRY